MTVDKRRLNKELTWLEEIARAATFEALQSYEAVPVELRRQLVLGTLFDGEDRIFELYVPGERPADALVFTSARINRHTRTVDVKVSNLARKSRA
jgi:hypothetical protein